MVVVHPGNNLDMDRSIGFTNTRVHYHSQLRDIADDVTKPTREIPMFSVVGEKE